MRAVFNSSSSPAPAPGLQENVSINVSMGDLSADSLSWVGADYSELSLKIFFSLYF
jgi:hypothetical protein